jgi:hypothetical protein
VTRACSAGGDGLSLVLQPWRLALPPGRRRHVVQGVLGSDHSDHLMLLVNDQEEWFVSRRSGDSEDSRRPQLLPPNLS